MTHFFGRTAGRAADITVQSVSPSPFSRPMLLVAILMLASLTGCGVKTDLVKPNGQPTPQNERDPSQPPVPIGR